MAEKPKEKGKPAERAKPEKPAEKPKVEKAAEKPVEKPVEAPAEKPKEKEKKQAKVKKKEKAAYTRYKIDEKGLTRLRPYCERCGPGYFMADHGDRFSCGHCGFTRYKRA
jgi:small subunit ribosomal protein S27Ae